MSAFDPSDVQISRLPVIIMNDRACVACGYNLKGLKTDGRCPECGRKISQPRARLFDYNMVAAPLPWLEFFAWGALLCLVSSFAFGVLALGGVVAGAVGTDLSPALAAVIFAAAALTWFAGVLIISRPRPVMPTTQVSPAREWATLRWSSRVTQVFWLVAALAAVTASMFPWGAGAPPAILGVVGLVALFVAVAGTIPLCVLASNLSFWASDSALAYAFRTQAWLIGWAVFLYSAFFIEARLFGFLSGGIFSFMMSLLWLFSILAPMCWGAACVWRFNSMAKWAVVNHVTAEDRDRRIREQARPAMERERARTASRRQSPPPLASGDTLAPSAPESPVGPTRAAPAVPVSAPRPQPADAPLNPYDVA